MASANLDLVRSICAAWERGDFHSSAKWAHPEIAFEIVGGPAPGGWTGADAAEGYRDFLSAWEDLRVEADEYRDLDDERVLVLTHFSRRGKKSGLELGQISTNGAYLFDVRGGKVTRLVRYWDRDRALAGLGLKA
jgi:ketosteroid isomerase-like protein